MNSAQCRAQRAQPWFATSSGTWLQLLEGDPSGSPSRSMLALPLTHVTWCASIMLPFSVALEISCTYLPVSFDQVPLLTKQFMTGPWLSFALSPPSASDPIAYCQGLRFFLSIRNLLRCDGGSARQRQTLATLVLEFSDFTELSFKSCNFISKFINRLLYSCKLSLRP